MKKISGFNAGVLSLLMVFLLTVGAYSQEKEAAAEEEQEDSAIGLSVGLTYYSAYLWRGTYMYDGEGAFYPSLSWEIFSTGLTLGVAAEFAADYFFEGKGRDAYGFDYHSFDAGLDYEYTFNELVTLGLGLWYWYYFNSEKAMDADASMLTAYVSLGFECLLSPFISFTYDYYVDKDYCTTGENKKDFYVQAGIGHEFEVTPEVAISLGLAAGYFHYKSESAFGISDIDASAGLCFTKGVLSLEGTFHYVAVPMKDFYEGSDIHRWYASFGAAVSF
ncbi:MAG TPA: hypothetical protein PK573_01000 [Spirochaetota bacterium]|nr:hypothetical protein [Spirochaetota bacterium]HRZ26114.1 hypothetical protein [Spirochaetota bacterium]HSA13437.1 hypothetical protein [Spirochaetota bacterium]